MIKLNSDVNVSIERWLLISRGHKFYELVSNELGRFLLGRLTPPFDPKIKYSSNKFYLARPIPKCRLKSMPVMKTIHVPRFQY
jgi:hypothetical protein